MVAERSQKGSLFNIFTQYMALVIRSWCNAEEIDLNIGSGNSSVCWIRLQLTWRHDRRGWSRLAACCFVILSSDRGIASRYEVKTVAEGSLSDGRYALEVRYLYGPNKILVIFDRELGSRSGLESGAS